MLRMNNATPAIESKGTRRVDREAMTKCLRGTPTETRIEKRGDLISLGHQREEVMLPLRRVRPQEAVATRPLGTMRITTCTWVVDRLRQMTRATGTED